MLTSFMWQVIEPALAEHKHELQLKTVVARATIEQVAAIEAILARNADATAAVVMLELQKAEWDAEAQAPRPASTVPSLGEVRRIMAQNREHHQSAVVFLVGNAGAAGVYSTSLIVHGVPTLCVVLAFPKAVQLAMESARSVVNDVARKVVAFIDGTYGIASSGLQVRGTFCTPCANGCTKGRLRGGADQPGLRGGCRLHDHRFALHGSVSAFVGAAGAHGVCARLLHVRF